MATPLPRSRRRCTASRSDRRAPPGSGRRASWNCWRSRGGCAPWAARTSCSSWCARRGSMSGCCAWTCCERWSSFHEIVRRRRVGGVPAEAVRGRCASGDCRADASRRPGARAVRLCPLHRRDDGVRPRVGHPRVVFGTGPPAGGQTVQRLALHGARPADLSRRDSGPRERAAAAGCLRQRELAGYRAAVSRGVQGAGGGGGARRIVGPAAGTRRELRARPQPQSRPAVRAGVIAAPFPFYRPCPVSLVNYATREITCKIVYYGPGRSGKTTNLHYIYGQVPTDRKGQMVSLATQTDRTLFFDFLPLDLGMISGCTTRFQLYTVPGQVYYQTTRRLVLQGADGVVFVADSQSRQLDENIESMQDLHANLAEHGIDARAIPLVIQYNKRDLPADLILPVSTLDDSLNCLLYTSDAAD